MIPVGVSVVIFVSRWAFVFWPLLCLLIFLRVAQDLPYFGPVWRSMFGEKTLWDWLSLLIVPAVLATLGFQFSLMNSDRDRANSVKSSRAELFQKYIDKIQAYAISGDLTSPKQAKLFPSGDCVIAAQSPTGLIVQNITDSTLAQLQLMETKQRSLHNEKAMILKFLYNIGSITRGENKISLENFDFSTANFFGARLKGACLNNIWFNDISASVGSASDFRRADLSGADLSGSNLARANLRGASLRNSILTGWASLKMADSRGADLRGIRYDKTTNFSGAIYNTKIIEIGTNHRWWPVSVLCSKMIQLLGDSGICIVPKDIIDLPPTRFPDEFYIQGRLEKLAFRSRLREINTLD
jgi:hypothetical protein